MSSDADHHYNTPTLSPDIHQEIALHCDKETLQAYCSASYLLRQVVAPFFFRASHIKLGIQLNFESSAAYHMASQQNYEAWASNCIKKFEQLSASGYAKHVRELSYRGFKTLEGPKDGVETWKTQYHETAWAIFKKSLSRYTQLISLRLEDVDIDDEAIIVMGTLQTLHHLYLTDNPGFKCTEELAMHHNVRPVQSLTYEPTFDTDDVEIDGELGGMFVAAACSNITSLYIKTVIGDGMQHNLYRILSNCPLLETLNIGLGTQDDPNMDETAPDGLERTAMPRLRDYSGPAYYAPLVKGRPVVKIHVYPLPYDLDDTNVADWVHSTFSGTTAAVESFTTLFFPGDAINTFLGAISITLPSLTELEMEIDGDFDNEVLECLVQDLHERVCVIPASLQTLRLFWLNESELELNDIVDKVVEILRMPERLGKLEFLTIGKTDHDYVSNTIAHSL
ncbi:hypothetical protein JR316_0006420 [Psilocybe cubensis]|uniref:Uncharacterized protein n=1 Tax=Psilocybe cubensis TaxID=181762 RepID=A0ACB8H2E0_PSICU|nr:hypothetical protein JR316_0006420 [Psilocybe cubensis]KAH9481890.1 hypothetical protein JR316_0006420 [Psilocybe cubensis]